MLYCPGSALVADWLTTWGTKLGVLTFCKEKLSGVFALLLVMFSFKPGAWDVVMVGMMGMLTLLF